MMKMETRADRRHWKEASTEKGEATRSVCRVRFWHSAAVIMVVCWHGINSELLLRQHTTRSKHRIAVKRVVKTGPLMGLIVQEEHSVNMCCINLNTSWTRVAIYDAWYGLRSWGFWHWREPSVLSFRRRLPWSLSSGIWRFMLWYTGTDVWGGTCCLHLQDNFEWKGNCFIWSSCWGAKWLSGSNVSTVKISSKMVVPSYQPFCFGYCKRYSERLTASVV
jgi:hypothetical protein